MGIRYGIKNIAKHEDTTLRIIIFSFQGEVEEVSTAMDEVVLHLVACMETEGKAGRAFCKEVQGDNP